MRLSLISLALLGLGLTLLTVPAFSHQPRRKQEASEFSLDIIRGGAQDLITRVKEFISSFLRNPEFRRDMALLYNQFASSIRKMLRY